MKKPHCPTWKKLGSQVSLLGVSTLITLSTANVANAQSLANPSFEVDNVQALQGSAGFIEGSGNPGYVTSTAVSSWKTTASNGGIEIWQSGFQGVNVANATNGVQFAEINATETAALFQDLTIAASASTTQLYFNFWHRARENGLPQINAIRLTITDLGIDGAVGGGDDVELFNKVFATQLTSDLGASQGWANYDSSEFGNTIFAAAGAAPRPIRFSYTALTGNVTADIYKTTNSNPTVDANVLVTTTNISTFGNFLDNAQFSTDPSVSVPFDFSPNLGIGILGSLYVGNRAFKSWKKSKNEKA